MDPGVVGLASGSRVVDSDWLWAATSSGASNEEANYPSKFGLFGGIFRI